MSTASPVIFMYDSKGKFVSDVITDFTYKFSEEEDDVCEFRVQSSDPLLADKEEWQEGQRLVVSWGYAGGQISNERAIFIFDTRCEYSETGITLAVTCHEKFAMAKMDSVNNKNLRQLKRNTPIIFSPEVLSNMRLEIDENNPELKSLLKSNDIPIEGVVGNERGENLVSYYNGNLSTFQNLRMYLDKMKGGPYIIDSRDDGVRIRTRNFEQLSSYTYHYAGEGQEILGFSAETKNRSKASASENTKVIAWDKGNKIAYTQNADGSTEEGATLASGKSIHDWTVLIRPLGPLPGFPDGVKKSGPGIISSLIKPGQKAVNSDKGTREDYQGKLVTTQGRINVSDQAVVKIHTGSDYGTRPTDHYHQAVDNLAVFKPKHEVLVSEGLPTKTELSNEEPAKAKAAADNERQNEEIKRNPASLKVIGNPILECGKIVTVLGVALRHKGNYYIIECEHRIDDSGYICNLNKMGRQGINIKEYISGKKSKKSRPVNYSQAATQTGKQKTKTVVGRNPTRQ